MFGRRTRLAALGAVGLGACAVLAACSPVKVGSAAIVGDQRITVSSLDTQVANFNTAAAPYGSQVQLTSTEVPAAVLSWLIRFQIEDEVAASAGISVTQAQVQQGIASVNSQAQQAAAQNGLRSAQAVFLNAGVSPQMVPALGMYQAQEIAFAEQANGGKLPATTAENNTVTAALTKAQCTAAKSLNIQVNPQFGRLDYSQYTVVPATDTLSRPARAVACVDHGPRPRVLTVLLSSPRVAPGLLTWQAWSALRAASRVLAGSAGHPQLSALTAFGVIPEVVELPADPAGQAAFLAAAVAAADGPVVWLAPAGEAADAALLAGLSAAGIQVRVLHGAQELPGAHLLDVVSIMDTLRVSCPWDREQTHASLVRYLLEEAYEAVETVEEGDLGALCEELGDVLFQTVFHSRVAAERTAEDGGFTIDDVADTLAAKLIRRHPHVFGSVAVSSADEVNRNWEDIKKAERSERAGVGEPSVLDGVAFGQPALSLAAQLQRRAQRAGMPAVPDDLAGAGDAVAADDIAGIGEELMRVVARACSAGLDPELELRAAARRYAERIRSWERSDG